MKEDKKKIKKCDHAGKWRPMPVSFCPTGNFQYSPRIAIYCRGCGIARMNGIIGENATYFENEL